MKINSKKIFLAFLLGILWLAFSFGVYALFIADAGERGIVGSPIYILSTILGAPLTSFFILSSSNLILYLPEPFFSFLDFFLTGLITFGIPYAVLLLVKKTKTTS